MKRLKISKYKYIYCGETEKCEHKRELSNSFERRRAKLYVNITYTQYTQNIYKHCANREDNVQQSSVENVPAANHELWPSNTWL